MYEKKYKITDKQFNKMNKLASDIYNTSIVIDFFCKNKLYIEECRNLSPVIKKLRKNADLLYSFFLDVEFNRF